MCADTPSSHGAGIKPKASISSAHWTAHKASPPSFLLLVKVNISNSSLIQMTATLLPQFLFNNTDVEGLRNKTGFVEFFIIFKIKSICGGGMHAYHATCIQVRGQFVGSDLCFNRVGPRD